jgi:hypothetical protein
MTKRLSIVLILTVAIAAGRTKVVSSQEDQSPEAKEVAARQAAAAKAIQARADQLDKSRQEWLDKQGKQSESNLNIATNNLASARARANENRFAEMQNSAALLLALSQKVHGELQAGGAQTIPVFFFKDLDEIEKTVKALRKTAK